MTESWTIIECNHNNNMTESWTITEYNQWINNGMPINENVIKLYLFKNQLTNLPDSIGNITKLIKLYLNDNNLTTYPESIINLTQLNSCSLKNLIEIDNLKKIKNKHKLYFNDYIFEELIAKSLHPSRMSQFLDYDSN